MLWERGLYMKIAITGGRGSVGQYVVRELLDHGYEVRAITRREWSDCPCEQVRDVSVTDYDAFKAAVEGCDALIHLANIAGPTPEDDRPDVFANNITANYNAMLIAGQLGLRRLVMASSVCALGYSYAHNMVPPAYFPIDEGTPATPDNSYGISKILTERMAERMVQRFPFMSIALLRITMVVEPPMYRLMNLPQYLDEERLWAHNMATYVDARDSAVAFRLALEADLQGAEVFYICNPDGFSNLDTRQMLAKYFPNSPLRAPIGPRDAAESSAKAARVLGWTPKHNWRDEVAASAPRTEKFGELPSDNWFI